MLIQNGGATTGRGKGVLAEARGKVRQSQIQKCRRLRIESKNTIANHTRSTVSARETMCNQNYFAVLHE